MAGGSDIVIDPAGEWPHTVDAAVPPGRVEEGAEAIVVLPFRQEVENLLFPGKNIRAAFAAGAGGTAGDGSFGVAEGMGKDAAAEPIGDAVQKRNPSPLILPGPFGPDDPALEPLDLAYDGGKRGGACGGNFW